MVRVHGEKGWIDGLRHQADRCELFRSGIEAVGVDALALTSVLGVSADIEKIFSLVATRVCACGVERQREQCYERRDNPKDLPACLHAHIEAHQLGETQARFG